MQVPYSVECIECGYYTESDSLFELHHSYECPKCKNPGVYINEQRKPN
jgi:Zn finger protein HypA/HybF involved in hydrogenase expression